MALAQCVAGLTRAELLLAFDDPSKPAFTRAAAALVKFAPPVMTIGNVECRHWVTFFSPENMTFAFYDPVRKKFHHLTVQQLKKQNARSHQRETTRTPHQHLLPEVA